MTRAEAARIARVARAANIPPLNERFWSKVKKASQSECWSWIAAIRNPRDGYGAFWLEGKHQPANRVAWQLTHGPIAHGLYVCHKCDNPRCCNPAHLFLGTHKDNNNDKVAKRRHCFGARTGTAKLSEAQAKEIKNLKPKGRAPSGYRRDVAKRFGVSTATITDVWSRRWMHIS